MKVHKDVQRKQSRQGAFNLDLPPAGLQTQPLVISPLRKGPPAREQRKAAVHLPAENAAGSPTPGRKLVPISDEEVEQRIHHLMEKERQNMSELIVISGI